MFKHRLGGHRDGIDVTFEVYDSVHGFTKKDWARVVCLFTSGEPFQLKDWPPQDSNVPGGYGQRDH